MKPMYRILLLLPVLALCACAGNPTKTDRKEGDWQVMTFAPKKGAMLCYADTTPTHSKGSAKERDKAYLRITRRASGKIEISTSAGFNFRKGSKTELVIDGKAHTLISKGDVAWASSDDEDKLIVATLKKAKLIEVRGFDAHNRKSMDYYSPAGYSDALARVRALCP